MVFRTLLVAVLAASTVASPAADQGEALRAAAAAGRLDEVRLLVERGADVNAHERFFGSTALAAALQNKHTAVALFLLAKGALGADKVLEEAIEQGNLELAKAALATGHLDRLDLLAARRRAALSPAGPVRDLLAQATPATPARPPFAPSTERLRAYAGRYRFREKDEATVTVGEASLLLSLPRQAPITFVAVAEDRFETRDGNARLVFDGRGGLVEGAELNRAGEVTSLRVIAADPEPLKAASIEAAATASREAPRPWPSFRGTDAAGNGDGQGAPLTWSVSAGQNIRFRTPLPGLAFSSPILWGDRIFVTSSVGASGDKTFGSGLYGDSTPTDETSERSFRLYALDAKTGSILWDREVQKSRPTVDPHAKSSQANATPVTDGKRVVALFGSVGLLVAYDFGGKALWRRDVGILECNDPPSGGAHWGHASSPILYRDLVIVQGDRVKDSFLAAYRVATGEEVWRVARDEPSSWATPNILRAAGGDELVANGQKIRAYDPATGALLWTLGPSSEVVVATPVVGDGLVYVSAGYPPLRPMYAIRPGKHGDLTLPEGRHASAAIAWSHEHGGISIPTPLLYKGYLYACSNRGILTCYRADTGEPLYERRLGETRASFASSPAAADDRIYFASESGEVFVLRAGPEYELLATNTMDEAVWATPAISDGLMVVRTLGHLVGIGAKPVASK